MLDFEIWAFKNRYLEPKGHEEVNGKSNKRCTNVQFLKEIGTWELLGEGPILLLEKIGSITFSECYIMLALLT